MFGVVSLASRRLEEHRPLVGDDVIDDLRALSSRLRGVRVLNLSLGPFGTGLAEMLHSLVPLMRDLGIDADWQFTGGMEDFGLAARQIYEGLSGRRVAWSPEIVDQWRRYGEASGSQFDGGYDVVVVHDPQPIGLPKRLSESGRTAPECRWVWHCHLDLRGAQNEVREALLPYLSYYDACVFHDLSFVPRGLEGIPVKAIPPAIDPTSPRLVELSDATIRQLLGRYSVDPSRPLVVQVGPFDSTFDPEGAIDIYRRVKAERSDLQLLLVHPMADNSLDGWSKFERVARHLGADPDGRVLVSQGDGGEAIVNAAQRAATVVVQRSVPAGFSIPVWEAQWKGRPVVAGSRGALPLQLLEGETGYLAEDDDGFAEAMLLLLDSPERAARLGEAGRNLVRRHHLITRLLADELRLLGSLLGVSPAPRGEHDLVGASADVEAGGLGA